MPVVIESDTFTHHEWLRMGEISQALKETENNHPKSVEELEELIDDSKGIQFERFQPIFDGLKPKVDYQAINLN